MGDIFIFLLFKIQHFFQSVWNMHVFAGVVFDIFMCSLIKVILLHLQLSQIFIGSALGHNLSILTRTSYNS